MRKQKRAALALVGEDYIDEPLDPREGHRMIDPVEVKQFALAGNARLTIVSKATGTRFSYRVRLPHEEDGVHHTTSDRWFVKVLTGPDNEADYRYLGMITSFRGFMHTKGSKISEDAPSCKAFKFFWDHLTIKGVIHEGIEVWHEGRCGKCGRTLTVPESIARGIGPDCAEQMGLI